MGEIKLIFMILGDINKSSIFEAFFSLMELPMKTTSMKKLKRLKGI